MVDGKGGNLGDCGIMEGGSAHEVELSDPHPSPLSYPRPSDAAHRRDPGPPIEASQILANKQGSSTDFEVQCAKSASMRPLDNLAPGGGVGSHTQPNLPLSSQDPQYVHEHSKALPCGRGPSSLVFGNLVCPDNKTSALTQGIANLTSPVPLSDVPGVAQVDLTNTGDAHRPAPLPSVVAAVPRAPNIVSDPNCDGPITNPQEESNETSPPPNYANPFKDGKRNHVFNSIPRSNDAQKLRNICRSRGLSVSGTRRELAHRVVSNML